MKMLRLFALLLICTISVLPCTLFSQNVYPPEVENVLIKAKTNRVELEKALNHYYTTGDPHKIKAINFLVTNMIYHHSANYYWADSLGKRLSYQELDYPDLDSSIRAFEELKKHTPKIHPVPNIYRDIDSIKGDYLIDNVDRAFAEWKLPWAKNIPFDDFCEYLLPYRVSVEPLQDWRAIYEKRFVHVIDSTKGKAPPKILNSFEDDCNSWFTNTFNKEVRKEPLPRLGALQLLHRKKGACEDGADLHVLAMRSQGIPATVDFIPYWATSSSSHFLYASPGILKAPEGLHDSLGNLLPRNFRMNREPGKVLRTTFSGQKDILAARLQPDEIPKGFLRNRNFIDVTQEYWDTKDLEIPIFNTPVDSAPLFGPSAKIAYACVFNTLDWRVLWWGKIWDGKAHFTNMCKGVVYLPMQYKNNKLYPAGYPMAVGYKHEQVLQPDTLHKYSITLKEQERYLKYHPQKKYSLYYWDNGWKLIGMQLATLTTKEMVFEQVPKNALLLMFPEDTQQLERLFLVTDTGQRVWF